MNCTTVQHIKLVADAALTTDVFQSAYDVFTSLLLAFLTRPLQMLHVYQLSHLPSEKRKWNCSSLQKKPTNVEIRGQG